MSNLHIEWQEKFFKTPQVFWLEVKIDGEFEPTGNLYDSEEALQHEIDWRTSRGEKFKVQSSYVHSVELAKERWKKL